MSNQSSFDISNVSNEYPNPLDEYLSYSYHFVMSIGHTTTAFEGLIGTNGDTTYLSRVSEAKHPGAEVKLENGESIWVVVDTRRFSAYQITDVQMEHMFGTGSPENPTVPVGATSLKIVDSTGMSFFNMLIDLFRNKVKSTRSSSFFLLSIIFTGHKSDGTTETIATCNIPLLMLSMSFELTHRGSEYELIMFETEGGLAADNPMTSELDALTDVKYVKANPTVGDMITALENALNKKSVDFYRNFINTAISMENTENINSDGFSNVGVPGRGTQRGKLVQYMFTVPDEWKSFKCSLAAKEYHLEQIHLAEENETITEEEAEQLESAVEEQYEYISEEDGQTQLSFSESMKITDAIKAILESSVDFLKLASEEKRLEGKAETFRTVMNITSDQSSYVIHYDLYPHKLPKLEKPDKEAENSGQNTAKIESESKGYQPTDNKTNIHNLITYNYIFTGKNSHVLDLKIKFNPESAIIFDTTVDIGQNRFASNAAAGQQSSKVRAAAEDGKKTDVNVYLPNLRQNDAIFPPQKTKEQAQNATSQDTESSPKEQAIDVMKAKQEYNITTAFMHFISSMNMNVLVRGNPNLLMKYADRNTRGGVAPHTWSTNAQTLEGVVSADSTETAIQNISGTFSSAKQQYFNQYVQPRIARSYPKEHASDTLLSGPDVTVEPVFCRLNLLAPNIDYTTGDFAAVDAMGNKAPMFTNEFFYNGPYLVLVMRTSFEGGEFTQDLSMIPYDASGTGDFMGYSSSAPANGSQNG